MKLKPGDIVNSATLVEMTYVYAHGGRKRSAWVCKMPGGDLKTIQTRSLIHRQKPFHDRAVSLLNRVFGYYRRNCKNRNIFWGITIEDFKRLIMDACAYCGRPPVHGSKDTFQYNGLDRKNNDRGYILQNVVPACPSCNQIKSNILSFDEMRVAMQAVVKWRRRKRKKVKSNRKY